ncbi:hypothetical protein M8330_19835 [Nocardioides sp. BSK12Z-4]|uniref:Uncharacterized protein n=1 Tax=Nocardioides bruguierae TaxID=2945102 RepID=A0A9X2DAV8_9ACTN|nr:hypothetical protein [Nocardioides bruguierae]MCM0622545.1 hypothetical protein [Nocardioides bruguierae]
MLHRLAGDEDEAEHVEVENAVEAIGGHIGHGCVFIPARVVDEDVNAAVGLECGRDQRHGTVVAGQIGAHSRRVPAAGADCGHDLVGGLA